MKRAMSRIYCLEKIRKGLIEVSFVLLCCSHDIGHLHGGVGAGKSHAGVLIVKALNGGRLLNGVLDSPFDGIES